MGLLALLLLLALLWWRNQPKPGEPAQSPSEAAPARHSTMVLAAVQPTAATAVAAPKQAPVKASESPAPPDVNDWGMVEFTDGVPVVRIMASGSSCVIIPTVITANGGNQIHLEMVVEKPGSLQLPASAIEALRGPAARNFIKSELSATRSDASKVIESMPSIVAVPGNSVRIGVGSAPDGNIISIELVPLIAGSHPGS